MYPRTEILKFDQEAMEFKFMIPNILQFYMYFMKSPHYSLTPLTIATTPSTIFISYYHLIY